MTNDYYRIGEFAKKTNTTIRTLHYYDEIGLLKPARTSKTGDRYYSTNEILTVQKIVTLKYLGYPLNKIQKLLNNNEWDATISFVSTRRARYQKTANKSYD